MPIMALITLKTNYYFRDAAFLTEITNMLKKSQTAEDGSNYDEDVPESLD